MKDNKELREIITSVFALYGEIADCKNYVSWRARRKVKSVLYVRLLELLGDLKKEEKNEEKNAEKRVKAVVIDTALVPVFPPVLQSLGAEENESSIENAEALD